MTDYDNNILMQFYIGCALILLTGAIIGAFATHAELKNDLDSIAEFSDRDR